LKILCNIAIPGPILFLTLIIFPPHAKWVPYHHDGMSSGCRWRRRPPRRQRDTGIQWDTLSFCLVILIYWVINIIKDNTEAL
jgi:hypothetical protein